MIRQSLIVLVVIIIIFLLYWKFWFLRLPERTIPQGEKKIVSPADGTVVSITKFGVPNATIEKGLLGMVSTITADVASTGYIIGIAMNPFNVHYQRAPIDGTITKVSYTPGKFRNALTSSLRIIENEHNEIVIKGNVSVKVIQVAGALARRIQSFVRKNDTVKKGQVIGLINLGSQTVLILPTNVILHVKEGQRVVDGETVIAEYTQ